VVSQRDPVDANVASARERALRVRLENNLPDSLPPHRATAVFCYGHCFHQHEAVAQLELVIGNARHRPTAVGMPRRDLFAWLTGPHGGGEDPAGRSYRSGFWGTVPIPAQPAPGTLHLQAAVRLSSGAALLAPLGRIEVVAPEWPAPSGCSLAPGTIAVCMATFDPRISLFAAQVESLRAQSDERWICVISDGGTDPERLAQMLAVIAGDRRFIVSRSPGRLDPYRNFERALRIAPREADLIAPCDQDDRWYPDKLAVLREALGSARLVYSDQRLVSDDGRVLRDSLWQGRRNDRANLASLLVANSVPGAAMLFPRSLAELALPFPDAPGIQYHDHWLALVALASGAIAYVERPLYDYVQHAGAVSGDVSARPAVSRARCDVWREGRRRARRGWRPASRSRGWRSAYFGGYLNREVQARTLLLRCRGTLTTRKRRALEWYVAAARRPTAFAWLAVRPLRRLVGRGETLGGETALARGILWRWLIALAVGGAQRPGRRAADASFPDPPRFEQRRLRRWRADD